MNKIAPSPRRLRAARLAAADPPEREEEARQFHALLKGLLPLLLNVEDATAEFPLRQLKVCAQLFEGPRSMSELSRQMGVTQSAMTQTADRLERAGLVERTFLGPDRRVRLLQLTAAGQAMIRSHEEAHVRRIADTLERLSDVQVKSVLDSLATMLAAAGDKE